MLVPGTQVGRAVDAGMGVTSTGKDQIAVQFEFPGGDLLTWYGYFTEAAFEITARSLAQLNADPVDLDWDMDAVCAAVVGSEIPCKIVEDTYQGQTRLKIDFIGTSAGGLGLRQPMDEAQKTDFRTRMRALARAKRIGQSRAKGGGAVKEGTPF